MKRAWGAEGPGCWPVGLQRCSVLGGRTPPAQKTGVFSLAPRTVSPELQRTTQAVRGTKPRLQGCDMRPQREQREHAKSYLHRAGQRHLLEEVTGRSLCWRDSRSSFSPFLSFILLLQFSAMKSYLEMFRYPTFRESTQGYFKSLRFFKFKIIQTTSNRLHTERERMRV